MTGIRQLSICLFLGVSAIARAGSPGAESDLLARLNDALFVRTAPDGEKFGTELDILFWAGTKHLLTSPSHEQAIRVLDEFIRKHGERSIRDPLQLVMLQRDLWELFDWSANREFAPPDGSPEARARIELQRRLVTIIKRLALSRISIARLPDNYFAAGSPHGIFAADSAWQLVGRSNDPAATDHVSGFGGRSVFLVFVKFPGGREPALAYLKHLREFTPALAYIEESQPGGSRQVLRTNPATPQFPAGTQWALVRYLCLIDDQGEIRVSPLVESIQLRTYDAVPEQGSSFAAIRSAQTFAEFQLDRRNVPALRATEKGDREFQFVRFRAQGGDPLELNSAEEWPRSRDFVRAETLRTCGMCHGAGRGILSVQTYSAFGLKAIPLEATTLEQEVRATRDWKMGQYDWGLFTGLWRTAQ